MDVTGIEVLIPAGAAVGGLVLGVLLARTSGGRSRARVDELEALVAERERQIAQLEAARSDLGTRLAKSEAEREQVSDQLTSYRAEVTGHFSQTSDLLREMTLHYRSIYQHLAEGAEALCPEGTLRLETHSPIEGLPGADDEDEGPDLEPLDEVRPGDDDGTSVEAAHTESPVQVDPRPEA
jgi:outer membrane murein-binding lipoprotein Lpp